MNKGVSWKFRYFLAEGKQFLLSVEGNFQECNQGKGASHFSDTLYEAMIKQAFKSVMGKENFQIYVTSFVNIPIGDIHK